ncbi:hypothetical protein [Acidovorax sp.]
MTYSASRHGSPPLDGLRSASLTGPRSRGRQLTPIAQWQVAP